MSRRGVVLPVFAQVTVLVAASVALAMAICFAAIVHAPPPGQPGFTIDQAVSALEGETVQTAEGGTLRRSLSATPPVAAGADQDPLARVVSLALQRHLGLEADSVRVRLVPVDGPERHRVHHEMGRRWAAPGGAGLSLEEAPRSETLVIRRSSDEPAAPPPPPSAGAHIQAVTDNVRGPEASTDRQQITVFTEELRFPPFIASVQLPDGQWATVSPPSSLWSPWHSRILLTFVGTLALLLPLAWWMARRLARPIRLFAEAAERLGSDPHAPPLAETGPTEVRNAAHAFNDMQAKLNRYVEGRTQMVAAIAHDLRTPLTRLRFRAEQAEPDIRDQMAADIEQMNGMISQALAYVRGETVREARAPLDLAALAASVVDDLAEIGADVRVEATGPVTVLGESLNLRRALANLIENAVKFAGAAEVAVAYVDGLAVVTVADTGPGLPPDELETVFEPFQRGEKSRNRNTGGAGLGLAVARGVARAHGGDVVLSNREGGGLVARLTLPAA